MINKAYIDIQKLSHDEQFSTDLCDARKRLEIPEHGYKNMTEALSRYFGKGPSSIDEITAEAIALIDKYSLPHAYYHHMTTYLVGESLCKSMTKDNNGTCEFDPDSGLGQSKTEVSNRWIQGNKEFKTLYISEDATRESINKYLDLFWGVTEVSLKKSEVTKHKEDKKLDRDMAILKLSQTSTEELEDLLDIKDNIPGQEKKLRLIKRIVVEEFGDELTIKTLKNIIAKTKKSQFK
ncbi:MAG: hypothetical protein ACJKTH_03370 [Patescibacteria group bacterium UBA2163]